MEETTVEKKAELWDYYQRLLKDAGFDSITQLLTIAIAVKDIAESKRVIARQLERED